MRAGGPNDESSHVTGDRPLGLLVVSPHALIRAGIHAVLAPYAGRVRVVDGPVAAGVARADVALCDLGGGASADGITESGVPVVAFVPSQDPAALQAALDAGAAAALTYDTDCEALLSVLEAVVEGREPRAAVARPGHGPLERARLSPREAEVLALIAAGHSNAEICERLYLSINSVKTYVRSAYLKIGVARRSHAVLWYLEATGGSEDGTRAAARPG